MNMKIDTAIEDVKDALNYLREVDYLLPNCDQIDYTILSLMQAIKNLENYVFEK